MLYISIYNQNTSVTVGDDQTVNRIELEEDMSTFSYLEGHILAKTIIINVKQMHVHMYYAIQQPQNHKFEEIF